MLIDADASVQAVYKKCLDSGAVFCFFLLFTNQLHLESNKVAEFESRHSCSFSSFFSLQLFTFKQYGALNVKKLIYYELDSCSL